VRGVFAGRQGNEIPRTGGPDEVSIRSSVLPESTNRGFFAVFCLVAAPYTGDAALTWLPLDSMSATAIILHVVYDLNQKGRKRKSGCILFLS
jgi:hypothetical protein